MGCVLVMGILSRCNYGFPVCWVLGFACLVSVVMFRGGCVYVGVLVGGYCFGPMDISMVDTFLDSSPSPTTSVPILISLTAKALFPSRLVTISATSTALEMTIPLALRTMSLVCDSCMRADIA